MISTDSEANEGLDVLMKMDRFDFEIRMLSTSPVYYQFRETITARNSKFIPLKNKITWKKLINIMNPTLNTNHNEMDTHDTHTARRHPMHVKEHETMIQHALH